MAGKPVALLGVAAGSIGAIKSLESLRGVVSHIGGIALPLPVSVANVQQVFDANGRCLDPTIEKLIRSAGTNLLNYIKQSICPRYTLERLLREGVPVAVAQGDQGTPRFSETPHNRASLLRRKKVSRNFAERVRADWRSVRRENHFARSQVHQYEVFPANWDAPPTRGTVPPAAGPPSERLVPAGIHGDASIPIARGANRPMLGDLVFHLNDLVLRGGDIR